MTDFKIVFSHPWMLFLLIPAALVTLLPYFLSNKKYRRNRNRIVPLVLRAIVCVMLVFVASGMTFQYDVPNTQNEVLLVVDNSVSSETEANKRDEFVQTLINEADARVNLGVVTFGYNQVYAVPMTSNIDTVYNQYLNAEKPDGSATDIAAALTYARSLFTYPKTAKIVLVSDGAETDGVATDVIRAITADGIKIDTARVGTSHDAEVEVIGVETPDDNVSTGAEFPLKVTLRSTYAGYASVNLYDNGVSATETQVEVAAGTQVVTIMHTVGAVGDKESRGLHEFKFIVNCDGDSYEENNTYSTYMYLQSFDKVLLIERTLGESAEIYNMLKDDYDVETATVNITACIDRNLMLYDSIPSENMPKSVNALRAYDQVVLVNISNADLESTGMPDGFVNMLDEYVSVAGGGLLTVGGNRTEDGNVVSNTYNRADMYGTLYQQMLPIQAINYTPPIAVIIIIDKSGSMSENEMEDGKTRLDFAKEGAISCLQSLSDRDYCGVMTLEDNVNEEIALTEAYKQSKLIEAIKAIESDGQGTVFAGAIEKAGSALSALSDSEVQHRHIILVTDGQPGDDPGNVDVANSGYLGQIANNYNKKGITFSVVNIKGANDAAMQQAVDAGHGVLHSVTDVKTLPAAMREELKNYTYSITEEPMRAFSPVVKPSSPLSVVVNDELAQLDGYYGVKEKDGCTVHIMGEFTPIYAEWKYGKGRVGSFMCDLNGTWSRGFIDSSDGVSIVRGIVDSLFPTESVRPLELDMALIEGNYRSQLEVYSRLKQGEQLQVTVTDPNGTVTYEHTYVSTDAYGRISIEHTNTGVYSVQVARLNANSDTIAEATLYKAFSYSAEYDVFVDLDKCAALMTKIAEDGDGVEVTEEEPWLAYLDVQSKRNVVIDPSIAFLIISAVLFLLDIAARKFKFRWPHEWIRDRKEIKEHKEAHE